MRTMVKGRCVNTNPPIEPTTRNALIAVVHSFLERFCRGILPDGLGVFVDPSGLEPFGASGGWDGSSCRLRVRVLLVKLRGGTVGFDIEMVRR